MASSRKSRSPARAREIKATAPAAAPDVEEIITKDTTQELAIGTFILRWGKAFLSAGALLTIGQVFLLTSMGVVYMMGHDTWKSHLFVYGPILAITTIMLRDQYSFYYTVSVWLAIAHGIAHQVDPIPFHSLFHCTRPKLISFNPVQTNPIQSNPIQSIQIQSHPIKFSLAQPSHLGPAQPTPSRGTRIPTTWHFTLLRPTPTPTLIPSLNRFTLSST